MPSTALLSSTHRILLVTSRPESMAWVVDALHADAFQVSVLSGGYDQNHVVPDMILFDVLTADSDEYRRWHQLKTNPLIAPVPIVFICASRDIALEWPGCLDDGHYIAEPQSAQELCAWLQEKRVFFGLALADHTAPELGATTDKNKALVQAAKRYLARHYASVDVMEVVAEALGTDAKQLANAFHDSLGVTVTAFLVEERMRNAQRLLLQSSADIPDIAQAVGYVSAARFTNVFREYAGVTPSVYRRNSPPDTLTTQGVVRWSSS